MNTKIRFPAAAAAALAALISAPFFGGRAEAADPAFITVGAGVFDVFHDRQAGDMRLEFRADRLGFVEPLAGIEATTDGATYVYGGFNIDILIGRRWVISPGFAVGYFSRGSGKDLGAKTEFHSGAEVAYRFDDRSRLGLALHHISNAGITKHNPGTEIISVTYSIPVGRIFNSN